MYEWYITIHYRGSGKIADWTDEELEKTAEAIGYGAIKYALYNFSMHI